MSDRQVSTTHISKVTGIQYRLEPDGSVYRYCDKRGVWHPHKAVDLSLDKYEDVRVQCTKKYGKGITEEYFGTFADMHAGSIQRRMTAMIRRPRYEPYMRFVADAIHQTTKQKEDTMSTFTAAQLEEKINPTAVKHVAPYQSVKELEKQNEDAACSVIKIANVAERGVMYFDAGTHALRVPEKYQNRVQRILADMRKDEEAILNETAAKLAKVQKALG